MILSFSSSLICFLGSDPNLSVLLSIDFPCLEKNGVFFEVRPCWLIRDTADYYNVNPRNMWTTCQYYKKEQVRQWGSDSAGMAAETSVWCSLNWRGRSPPFWPGNRFSLTQRKVGIHITCTAISLKVGNYLQVRYSLVEYSYPSSITMKLQFLLGSDPTAKFFPGKRARSWGQGLGLVGSDLAAIGKLLAVLSLIPSWGTYISKITA